MTPDGLDKFSYDENGEVTLYNDKGHYFRSEFDFDYGWAYRTPTMGYSQLRRTWRATLVARIITVAILGFLVVSPVILSIQSESQNAAPIIWVFAGVNGAIIAIFIATIWNFAWYGRMTDVVD